MQFKYVTFPSREDHIQLQGWFIPGVLPNGSLTSQRTIVFVHGSRTNRADKPSGLLDLSVAFARNGFAVLAFDMRGAEYSHEDGQCTFQTIVARHGLDSDPALVEMGRIILDADVPPSRTRRAEAAGVAAGLGPLAHGPDGAGAASSLIGELSWYFRNDVGNANSHWIKLNVERQLARMQGRPGTVVTLQYYFYR